MPYQASCWSTSVSIFLQGTTSNGPYITLLSYAVIFIEIYFGEIYFGEIYFGEIYFGEIYFVEIYFGEIYFVEILWRNIF